MQLISLVGAFLKLARVRMAGVLVRIAKSHYAMFLPICKQPLAFFLRMVKGSWIEHEIAVFTFDLVPIMLKDGQIQSTLLTPESNSAIVDLSWNIK